MVTAVDDATILLEAWGTGDQTAANRFFELVYKELKRLAAHYMRVERMDHTLQPTALVHELYIKLFSGERIELNDRAHFFAIAARQLRRIVVDYARGQHAVKRGGNMAKTSIQDAYQLGIPINESLLHLDLILDRLAGLDARAAQVVEMRYFGGLTEAEVAEYIGISVATVKRDWDFARTWLLKEMS